MHEFAHSIMNLGIVSVDRNFTRDLTVLYNDAMDAGLRKDSYAATNTQEYWAEGVQSYFNANHAGPSKWHNHVNTREELREYDPKLFQLIAKYFPAYAWTAACPPRQ